MKTLLKILIVLFVISMLAACIAPNIAPNAGVQRIMPIAPTPTLEAFPTPPWFPTPTSVSVYSPVVH